MPSEREAVPPDGALFKDGEALDWGLRKNLQAASVQALPWW